MDVDQAKKALFSSARLRAFPFVVYQRNGPNLLVFAATCRKKDRTDLLEWEKVFGEGFVAVLATQATDARLRFRRLHGEEVTLEDHNPVRRLT